MEEPSELLEDLCVVRSVLEDAFPSIFCTVVLENIVSKETPDATEPGYARVGSCQPPGREMNGDWQTRRGSERRVARACRPKTEQYS